MDDLISIVIPVYNVEAYLKDCFESVGNQTYDNIEIIVVDDGSTDNSSSICEEFKRRDSRVNVIHQQNSGLSGARNTGLSIAKGKYITFIDSDDLIELDFIEYLYNMIIENAADISVCQRQSINENGQHIDDDGQFSDNIPNKVISGGEELMKVFLYEHYIDTVAWGKLYLTSLFSDIKYPVGKYHEDVFTTYKLIAKAKKLIVGFEKKYWYRKRTMSISNSSFSIKHLDAIDGAKERADFILKNYPNIKSFANASIVYATNQCLRKLSDSNYFQDSLNLDQILNEFQAYYRKYELDFLKSKSGFIAKIYSLLAFINVKFVFYAWRIIKGIK